MAKETLSGWFDSPLLSRSAGSFGLRSPQMKTVIFGKLYHYQINARTLSIVPAPVLKTCTTVRQRVVEGSDRCW